ncbi:MAG: metal-sulfur cluster assembly factor [Candidatus Anstonellales archaeon]
MNQSKVKEEVLERLSKVIDAEVGISIVDLGLIYGIEYSEKQNKVFVKFTLTTPACPLANTIIEDMKRALEDLPYDVELHLVWEPMWNPSMISEEGKRRLRI